MHIAAPARRLALAAASLLACGSPLLAAEAAPRPELAVVVASLPVAEGELLAFAPDLGERLASLPAGEALVVRDFPTAPGERSAVELSRLEVYGAESRIVAVRGGAVETVPRSRLRFFVGRPATGGDERVLLTLEGDRPALREAAVYGAAGGDLRLEPAAAGGGWFLLGDEPPLPEAATAECTQENTVLAGGSEPPPAAAGQGSLGGLHTAVVAVDTDNELMSLKFGNNLAAATDYIAALFAGMNVMYERDLSVRLVQGLTILRPSTTPDPYTNGTNTYDGLVQFGNHWAAGCGGACSGVDRALAMMLSGKAANANSAAGIAWLDVLCSGSNGYSFSQVFKFTGSTAAHDVKLVGHELGHNFGSPHTHCYSPPIDTCYGQEPGCFSGGGSCPAPSTINGVTNVRGTVMSYCHLLGGCGASSVFHDRSVDRIAPEIASRVGQCIFPAGGGSVLFADGFDSGGLGAWN